MAFVLIIAGGLVVAGINTWQRLGRSSRARAWSRGMRKGETRRDVLVQWPLIAIALVAGGLAGLLRDSVGATVVPALVFLVSLVLWFAYLMLPLPVPRVVQPRWYRERTRKDAEAGRS
jgi:hypothetical protein